MSCRVDTIGGEKYVGAQNSVAADTQYRYGRWLIVVLSASISSEGTTDTRSSKKGKTLNNR